MNKLTGFKIPRDGWVTQDIRKKVGAFAITVLQARFSAGNDVTDGPAPAYSQRGPVYLSLQNGKRQGVMTLAQAKRAYQRNTGIKSPRGLARAVRSSLRFENYSAMKQYLGYPSYRNLKLSGKMLGAIAVTSESPTGITIGFKDSQQEAKMRGNQKRSNSWGFSPQDQAKIAAMFQHTMLNRFRTVMTQAVARRTK